MEKQPHQEYRDELSDRLKEIRNHSDDLNSKEDSVKYLEEQKQTSEYVRAKLNSLSKRWHLNLETSSKEKAKFFMDNWSPVKTLIPGIDTKNLISIETDIVDGDNSEKNKDDGYLDDHFVSGIGKAFESLTPEQRKEVKESFKDKIVIDIGAGSFYGYLLACSLGAKGYISVEPYNYNRLLSYFLGEVDYNQYRFSDTGEVGEDFDNSAKPVPFNMVKEDALTFLKRLPDDSVIPFTFGTGDLFENQPFAAALKEELGRIIPVDSFFLNCNSFFPNFPKNKKIFDFRNGRGNDYFYTNGDKKILTNISKIESV